MEILITVLVLSIGLLGLAGLQVSSMKSNHSSYLRSQATILAYDIADRMRANPAVAYIAKSPYAVNLTVNPYTVAAPSVTASCSTTAGCTAGQMANTDINQWRVDLANTLPGGVGVVCVDNDLINDGPDISTSDMDCVGGSIIAIKIWWNDTDTNTIKRFTVNYQP